MPRQREPALARLSSFDASFLSNEKGNGHMAIGAVMICAGQAPSQEELFDHVRSRLHLLPRFRQRLVSPPMNLGRPFWVDDPDFDVAGQVRRVALPEPGTEQQFRAMVGDLLTPPLDRGRPLWQLCLVEGCTEERFGIVYRVHHALADGFSAVDIAALLFDLEPHPEPVAVPPNRTSGDLPSRADLLGRSVDGFTSSLNRVATWVTGAARRPRKAGRRAADGLAGLREVVWAMAKPAPQVPLNADIGPERHFIWTGCRLDDLKRVKNALGGTVNDVSLAVCAGALRRHLHEDGVSTDGLDLKALVPVSVRTQDERGKLGNKLTALRGTLPVGIADPVDRLRAVSGTMQVLKDSKQPLGAEAIWQINDWFRDFAPPLLLAPTAAINFSTRIFNLLVTNFPGPQTPLYILGRQMVGIYPVGFLARRHRLAIAIISYDGSVNFGLLADSHFAPNLERMSAYIDQEIEDLIVAAEAAGSHDG